MHSCNTSRHLAFSCCEVECDCRSTLDIFFRPRKRDGPGPAIHVVHPRPSMAPMTHLKIYQAKIKCIKLVFFCACIAGLSPLPPVGVTTSLTKTCLSVTSPTDFSPQWVVVHPPMAAPVLELCIINLRNVAQPSRYVALQRYGSNRTDHPSVSGPVYTSLARNYPWLRRPIQSSPEPL